MKIICEKSFPKMAYLSMKYHSRNEESVYFEKFFNEKVRKYFSEICLSSIIDLLYSEKLSRFLPFFAKVYLANFLKTAILESLSREIFPISPIAKVYP